MSDNGATLTVDRQGFVWWGPLRLPCRYEGGELEFAVKDKRLWATVGKRVRIPKDKFAGLEQARCEGVARSGQTIDKSN